MSGHPDGKSLLFCRLKSVGFCPFLSLLYLVTFFSKIRNCGS